MMQRRIGGDYLPMTIIQMLTCLIRQFSYESA
ncbi:hypothetical protein RCCS2_04384 [Roseobacter sp. CCS2]|nr:hypothetical protein RCCS2_04384 [Roseobacter sp. CCS2]